MDSAILAKSKTSGMLNETHTQFQEMKYFSKFKECAVRGFNKLFKILTNSSMIESKLKLKIQVQCQTRFCKKEVECSVTLDF